MSAGRKHQIGENSHSSHFADSEAKSIQRGAEIGMAEAVEQLEQQKHTALMRKKRKLLQKLTMQALGRRQQDEVLKASLKGAKMNVNAKDAAVASASARPESEEEALPGFENPRKYEPDPESFSPGTWADGASSGWENTDGKAEVGAEGGQHLSASPHAPCMQYNYRPVYMSAT